MMEDTQKEDLQFWFYNHVFIAGKSLDYALGLAAKEVGIPTDEALEYMTADGRLEQNPQGQLQLVNYSETKASSQDIFVDMDWMMALFQDKTKLRGPALYRALSVIYKLSPQDAEAEAGAYDFTVPLDGED